LQPQASSFKLHFSANFLSKLSKKILNFVKKNVMKKAVLLLVLLFAIQVFLLSQEKTVTYFYDAAATTQEKIIDIKHYKADLSINPYDTLVQGKIEFSFIPLREKTDSIIFYSPDISFTSVLVPGVKISYAKKGDNLVIFILSKEILKRGEAYKIEMIYSSKPKYDLFFIGWNEPALRDNKQIWAHRPFHWLPYYGDRLTADLRVTFDAKYRVMSNGVRESVKDNGDSTKTWHYSMKKEHPFFSTCLVIGDYRYLELETDDGLPLELWYYAWQEDHAEPTYRYTREMFSFFNDEFGLDYPYELYREAPVEDYLYGAMETTTATVFGDYLAVDERAFDGRNYVNVNAHELAHQWFGNCLSHQRHADVWLTESFATYYAKMFEKHVFGEDYYQWVRDVELTETLDAAQKDSYPVGHGRGGRARWYPKGSLVLDMMRNVLGDEGFKASVSRYTNQHAFSEVETAEFLSSIYEATGQSLEWFFDQWINRGGEPFYNVEWQRDKSPDGTAQTLISVTQAHDRNELTGLFKMPFDIEVYYDDGSVDKKKQWIEKEYSEVIIDNQENKTVSFVLFDPGRKVLKKVSFPKSLQELSAQALHAPSMIDRYDALLAMRDFPAPDKKETLRAVWEKETFHLTRAEAMKQIFQTDSTTASLVFSEAIRDEDPLVRRAALENMKTVPLHLKAETENLLLDISYINVEKALGLLSVSFPLEIPKYLEATKNETGWRGRNIRMKWLEIALQAEQREYLGEITDYAGPHYEFETRINAFHLLKRLNYLEKTSAFYLMDGLLYWNYKVSNAAREVLKYFYQQNKYKELIDETFNDGRFSEDEKNKIKAALGFI
jgi:aminopeptidase N